MWFAKRDSPLSRAPAQAPRSSQRPQGSTPSLTISTRWRDSTEAHDAQPRAHAATAPGSPPPTWARDLAEGGYYRRAAAAAASWCWWLLQQPGSAGGSLWRGVEEAAGGRFRAGDTGEKGAGGQGAALQGGGTGRSGRVRSEDLDVRARGGGGGEAGAG